MADSLTPLVEPQLRRDRHVGASFSTRDEEYRALLPFITAGLERGEKSFQIVDRALHEDHLRRLRSAGVDTAAAELSKQLEIREWQDAGLIEGHFDPNRMISLIEAELGKGAAQGFPATRLVAYMDWVLRARPAIADFLEYEARLNDVLLKYTGSVVCVYDYTKFDANVAVDLLRTHPTVAIGEVAAGNPFYLPPDQFLREVRERSADPPRFERRSARGKQLRQGIQSLLALSGVQASWAGHEQITEEQIAERLVTVLVSNLRLAVAHVRLNSPGGAKFEASNSEKWPAFAQWVKATQTQSGSGADLCRQGRIELPTDHGTLYIVAIPIGLDAEAGMLVLGSQRPKFPTEIGSLFISVVANHALLSFFRGRAAFERKRMERSLMVQREEFDRTALSGDIVGDSPAFRSVQSLVSRVAPTDSTVLITGETGTGKELVARAIHKLSKRAARPFISVNCAALPQSLIGTELFGHEKGAFTGAEARHLGRFEMAHQGTLFLDKIGDLPAETQIALLRVLQERQFERVGGNRPISVDVRVIAATNRKLEEAVAAGTFRQELFYRLNVFPIEVPPLRARREAIPALAAYLVERYAKKTGKKIKDIDNKSLDLLQSYDWPGNVRELQNVIERSVILCEDDSLSLDERWLSRRRRRQRQGFSRSVWLIRRSRLSKPPSRKAMDAYPVGRAQRLSSGFHRQHWNRESAP